MSTLRSWLASQLDKRQYRDYNVQLCDLLRDGADLCALLQRLGVSSASPSSTVGAFLASCAAAGVGPRFTERDLAEGREQPVVRTLEALRARFPQTPKTPQTPQQQSKCQSQQSQPSAFGLSVRRGVASAAASGASSPIGSPCQPLRRAHSDAPSSSAAASATSSSSSAAVSPPQQAATSQADDMKLRAAFKYSPEVHENIREWVRAVLGDPACVAPGADLGRALKDGVLLCRLIAKLAPGSVPRAYEGAVAFRQIENVANYLRAAAEFGLRKEDLFDVPDLFEGRNLNMVIQHVQALAQTAAKRPGYRGPTMKSSAHVKSLYAQALCGQQAPENVAPSGPLSPEEQDLLAWANAKLRPLMLTVADLSNDLRNGVKLCKLVEQLSGGLAPSYNDAPATLWDMLHNASQFISFLSQQSIVRETECTAQDIVTGNRPKIAGLLRLIRERYDLDFVFQSALNEDAEEEAEIAAPDTAASATAASKHPRSSLSLSQRDLQAFEEEERKFVETLRQKSGIIEPQSSPSRKDSRETQEREKRKQRYITRKKIREERRISGVSPLLQSAHPPPLSSSSSPPPMAETHTRPRAGAVSAASTSVPTATPEAAPEADQKPQKDHHRRHHHHHKKDLKKSSEDAQSPVQSPVTSAISSPQLDDRRRALSGSTGPISFSGPAHSSWPSLEMALDDPILRADFRTFLESEFALENLLFYDDAVAYKRRLSDSKEMLFAEARRIFDEYLTADSENEINISWPTKQELQKTIAKGPGAISLNTWDAALSEVVRLLRSDLYVRWYRGKQPPSALQQPQQPGAAEPTPSPRNLGILGSISSTALRILGAKEQVRARVVAQLVASEQTYVDNLAACCELVFEPALKRTLLSEQELWNVFANLPLLLAYHRILFARLEEAHGRWQNHLSTIGDVFLECTHFFELYSIYMRNYPTSIMSYRQFCITRDAFEKLVREFKGAKQISVEQVLEMPFQRLETYVTHMRSLQKYTPKGHRDAPMIEEVVTRLAKLCSDMSSELDLDTIRNSKRLLNVADSIAGLEGQVLIVPGRRLLFQGAAEIDVIAQSGDANVFDDAMLFLFSDLLVCCKAQQASSTSTAPYAFVASLPLLQVQHAEPNVRNDHKATLVTSATGARWLFQARTSKETDEWTSRLLQWIVQQQ